MDLIGIIATALLSGVTATLSTFYLSDSRERWQLRRTKIEEIYISFQKWSKSLVGHYILWFPVLKGQVTLDQLHDNTIKKGSSAGDHYDSLQMNIYMYHPDLGDLFNEVLSQREKMNAITSHIKARIKDGEPPDYTQGLAFDRQLEALNRSVEALTAAIVAKGRDIAAEPSPASTAFSWLGSTARNGWQSVSRRIQL